MGTAQGCEPPQQPKAPLSCTASPISILLDATGSRGKRSSVGSSAYVKLAGNEAGSSSERASDGEALPSSRFLELAQLGIYTDHAPMGEGGYGSVYRHENSCARNPSMLPRRSPLTLMHVLLQVPAA